MKRYEDLRRTRPELFGNEPGGYEILSDPREIEAARHRAGVGPEDGVGVVYADPYITVLRDPVRCPGGALGLYARVLPTADGPAVAVLPLTGGGGDVVLIEHYRHATRRWHLEVPRGHGEPATDGPTQAATELEEELGVRPDELIPLGALHPDSGLLGGCVELYAARIPHVGELDAAEGIRRAVTVPAAEAERMAGDGTLTDGFTVAVLARARWAGLLGT